MYLIRDDGYGVFVFWLEADPGSPDTTFDLLLQRLDYTGAPASGWPAQGVVVRSAGAHAPTLVPRYLGRAIDRVVLVWGTTATGDLSAEYFYPYSTAPIGPPIPLCTTLTPKGFTAASVDENSGGLAVT